MEKVLKFLKNKKYLAIYLVGVLLLSTGVSYAYFRATSSVSGSGSVASGVTATVSSEGVIAGGNISVSEADIYPGHKAIASIKATGTGDNTPLIYNLIFNGTNTFTTDINYKVYKTTTNINASYNCIQEQNVVDGSIHYYETCSGTNIDSLGEVVSSGIISKGETTTKTTLLSDEIILTIEEGREVYYYVEIEYPNNNANQNNDIGSSLSGNITVERSEKEYTNPSILFTASTTAGSNNWYRSVSINTSITTQTGKYEALYCTTTSSSCTPNQTPTISNNQFSVTLSNNTSSQKVCVRVVDEYNQVTEGCSNAYSVDNTNPTISITSTSATSGNNGWYKSVSMRATGSDAHSGVASIQYCTTTSSSCTPTTSSSGSSATINLSSNASARRACARSVDNAGNVSEVTCSNAYSVDSTRPTISITSTSVTSNSITVTVRGSDSHSGIYQYKFSSNNGSSYTTVTSSNGTYSYTFNNLNDDTTYTIAVQSVDRAGNTSSKVTRNVTTEVAGQTIQEILAGYNKSTRSDFSVTYTLRTTKTVFTANDGDGTTYYFAGAPTDNYVSFAGFYWRIIRVNGDGSIRLIYQGTSATATGSNAPTGTSFFNSTEDRSEYVGLKYSQGSQYGTNENSTIYTALNTWYTTNIANKNYGNYIDTNAGFCGDRDMASGSTWESQPDSTIYYAAYGRLYDNRSPVFTCSTNNLYTATTSNKGNKSLSSPIGLITLDEAAFAGGVMGRINTSYYLYTGGSYWTMSPFTFDATYSIAYLFILDNDGWFNGYRVSSASGVRPVINLKADTQFTGSGTSSDPFVVV